MVRRRAGLAETDDEATTRERIADTVAEYVPDADDRRWVEPALLTLLGLEPPPPGGRDVLFAAWRIFFERIAERGPTVLLFEDLQWADSGLLDFIDHLLEWSKGVPILVVTLARPELFDRRPDWGAGTRHLTALALEPLTDERDARAAGGLRARPARERRARRSSRAPTACRCTPSRRSARSSPTAAWSVSTTRYRPVGDLGDPGHPGDACARSSPPASTRSSRSIAASSRTRRCSARSSPLAGLAAVSGDAAADELEPRLRALVRRELLEVEADPRSPERGQYRFVQSLIREVAYGTLARRDRRARHLAAARYFESLGDDELAGVLASHYLAAHEASTPGARPTRSPPRRASPFVAPPNARRASVPTTRPSPSPSRRCRSPRTRWSRRSCCSRARARRTSPGTTSSRRRSRGRRSSGTTDDAAGAGRTSAQLGQTLIDAGRVGDAVPVLEAGLKALPADGHEDVRATILTNLSRALFRNDQPARAIEVADQALPIAERLDLEELIAEAFNNKASALSYVGRRREAVAHP